MQIVRPFGTLGRVLRRFGSVGLCGGILGAALFYGCAGTNQDYAGNVVDGGVGDASTSGPPDFTCVKNPNDDLPDDQGLDTDCDGLDGTIGKAIFVSPTGDNANLGTMESPVQTITQGLFLAQQQQKHGVYLSMGTYNESVKLVSGIGIYGGYDAANKWIRLKTNTTVISGGSTAITGSSINQETHIDWVTIQAAAGSTGTSGSPAGGSSYGVIITNSSGPVKLVSDSIIAGNGGNGFDSAAGAAGATGGNGGNGIVGCEGGGNCGNPTVGGTDFGSGGRGGLSTCLRPGGAGGLGQYSAGGQSGQNGSIFGSGGGQGGPGAGKAGCPFGGRNDGTGGNKGNDGTNGTNGGAATLANAFAAGGYLANTASGGNGIAGTSGHGGGGGGAGGGSDDNIACTGDRGGGGGGGGAGGCAATAGGGGGGGGGSFAVYSYASTVVLENTAVKYGSGGKGGNGGNGATGGGGGSGGQGGPYNNNDGGQGGGGAAGGRGGNSGGGAGGIGGPAFGLYTGSGNKIQQNNVTFGGGGTGGAAGIGGVGLGVQAPNGSTGQRGDFN